MGAFDNKTEAFTFPGIPNTLEELKTLPESTLDTPYKTAALVLLALCRYRESPEAAFEMLEYLNGPDSLSVYTKSFITERLKGKEYKPFSYFAGATPENGYTPSVMRIEITSNPYSFKEENRAVLFVTSAGADSPRQLSLRKKPSTGEWFCTEIMCLSDIRTPGEADPWA